MPIFNKIAFIDFSLPVVERARKRRFCGPRRFTPATAGRPLSFYMRDDHAMAMERFGCAISLRLYKANAFLKTHDKRLRNKYPCDFYGDLFAEPIIAMLPRGNGYLAGWSLGGNMVSQLDRTIYDTAEEAAAAAHEEASYCAQREREELAEIEHGGDDDPEPDDPEHEYDWRPDDDREQLTDERKEV